MTGTFIQPIGEGSRLDRYCLLRLLGRGGMGEVWLAEDTGLHRQIALKILLPVMRHDAAYLKAFAHEAQLAAAVEHPHILPVHDFGEIQRGDEIVPYLILPHIHGGSLKERLEQHTPLLLVEQSLAYVRQAAEAIDYAHSQSLLHRDIKPANMLLQSNDWLFLADFGLARLLTNTENSRTHAGAGTPAYMSPEQIRGHTEKASDIYSLACVAYQLLTGHTPFEGEGVYAILRQQIQDDPPDPRHYNPLLPPAIEQVLLKSLAKQPAARHATCIEFVAALEQAWADRPQIDREEHRLTDPDATEIAPWNRQTVASQPTALDHTMISISTETQEEKNTHIAQETDIAPTKASHPDTTRGYRLSRRELFIGGTATALFLLGGGSALATGILGQGPRSGPQQLIQAKARVQLQGHSDGVESIKWHPAGRFLATGSDDTHMMVWDLEPPLAHPSEQMQSVVQPAADWKCNLKFTRESITWSPDGQKLAFITYTAKIQDVSDPGEQNDAIVVMSIFQSSPSATYYADNFTRANSYYSSVTTNRYRHLTWSPDGKTLASIINEAASIALWSLNQDTPGKYLDATMPTQNTNPYVAFWACAWSQDGTQMFVLDNELATSIYDPAKGTLLARFSLPDRSVALTGHKQSTANSIVDTEVQIVASPRDPAQFAVSNGDTIAICDSKRKKVLRTLGIDDPQVHTSVTDAEDTIIYPQISALAWSPNGRYIVGSYVTSPRLFIWDLYHPHVSQKEGIELPLQTFDTKNGHRDIILAIDWSPDGRYLATASQDSTVIIWQMDA